MGPSCEPYVLQLTDDAWCDEDELENRKHAQLQIGNAVAEIPEREAGEQPGDDVQGELVVDIVDIAVNSSGHACSDEFNLGQ